MGDVVAAGHELIHAGRLFTGGDEVPDLTAESRESLTEAGYIESSKPAAKASRSRKASDESDEQAD